ncbi:Pyrimidine-specific ribonucleoside hydrolase RihA [Luteitalea pratensis]|uniref:Pyrimidine-specific ribonucleoside hydrolase RihA n=2 Tax=Luteitalea pratensis TaxID=1855912 RepID=A0A143PHL9_LUTPR|nr:Pyrimidine-specific ribonucleoside hydrolase RihA [Luteitalea pratensis]
MIVTAAACRSSDAPPDDGRIATWLDISPAIGDPPRNPGDALALLQAYGSGRLGVRGVSVTFGNVPLERGLPAAQELLKRLDSGLLRAWRGASAPDERAAPTEATELLQEALGKEPLTIVATGPMTTVASVLLRHPAMASRIQRVILVAGTSVDSNPPGPRSESGPYLATTPGGAGISARDANVEADAPSLQVLLDSPVALTVVSPSLATGIGLDAADLDRLDEGHGPIKLITPPARAWLQAVRGVDDATAFAVPAMLAVDVAAHPGDVRCEAAVASVATPQPHGPRLLIASSTEGRRVTWCHTADPGAKARIIADVLRVRQLPR